MDAEGIERVIVLEPRFQFRAGEEWNRSCQDADNDRTGGVDKTAGWSDDNKSADRARAKSKDARFTSKNPFQRGPGRRRDRGREGGTHEGVGCDSICPQRATRVESIPTDPKHSRSNHAKDHRVRCHDFFTETEALSQKNAE